MGKHWMANKKATVTLIVNTTPALRSSLCVKRRLGPKTFSWFFVAKLNNLSESLSLSIDVPIVTNLEPSLANSLSQTSNGWCVIY